MLSRCNRSLALALPLLIGVAAAGQQQPKSLNDQPITTAGGKVGDLLRQWWKEGTAAGNVGDWYDNRDGAHSDLNMGPYPQLQRIVYSEEDIKLRKHWAAQRIILPHVTFGNSSTSGPPHLNGSNPRSYYTLPAGIPFLYSQYRKNNLYIYPEHLDHDPGRNGKGGYGDLFPANTPYLIISQGSSGSDQPFMQAIPYVLAAFRPEVKKKLTEEGLLMPTVQWLLRTTNRHLKDPKEYLTGKAHPTVFEGGWVDQLAMVQKAHDLTLDALPPHVQFKVLEEDQPRLGIDYFDPVPTEKLADTPGAIARIFRGKDHKRRMVVSAAASFDVNKKPLTFTWVVLRGDPEAIKITPRNQEGSEAEIVVSHRPRTRIEPGAELESNRTDIGVFAHNGTHYSPPAFVTFYSLDSESRTYDEDGRLLDIGYGAGLVVWKVTDWDRLLEIVSRPTPELARLGFTKEECEQLGAWRKPYRELATAAETAAKNVKTHDQTVQSHAEKLKSAEAALKLAKEEADIERLKAAKDKLEAELQQLRKQAADLAKAQQAADGAVRDLTSNKIRGHGPPPLEMRLRPFYLCKEFHRDAEIDCTFASKDSPSPAVLAAKTRLIGMGFAQEREGKLIRNLVRGTWRTNHEGVEEERFYATLLSSTIFQGAVSYQFERNFVDPRLTIYRDWRDVYRYDEKGRLLGWRRYDGARVTEFSAQGLIVVEKDKLGRCTKGRTARYHQEPHKGQGVNPNPLQSLPGDAIVTVAYQDEQDFQGRAVGKDPIPDDKK